MNAPQKQTVWFVVSIIPVLFVSFGTLITYLSYAQLWGGSTQASTVFGVFFSEVALVVTAFGLLGYLRTYEKTALVKNIARLNWCIVAYAVTAALYFFLS
ncbi:hypothetical protein [Alkalimarinus alittae]|uniref:Uncharacterized protein n=1 Tax=Alkalimarinus alittae TaxID=2961619 RepID=A0ABY6N0N6_9ALTE|nr:hypothetical protein [Alkalimarinus alittae]UZE95660.1 hypothetical protein NKI27_16600 [Alkalimarinus alittae]